MGEPIDGRCTDYCNDPAVVYHAHDLPRCKNVANVQIKGRWLCNTHARLSTTEAALADANAEIERMKAACHHGSQALEGEGLLRCELCGAVEHDPFWRNPA